MFWLILLAFAVVILLALGGRSPSPVRPNDLPPKNGDVLLERFRAAEPAEMGRIRNLLKLNASDSPDEVASKFRKVAGNTFANLGRRLEGPSYHQILVDVADKLKPGVGWTKHTTKNSSIEQIEDEIWQFALERCRKALDKLSPEKRQAAERVLNDQLRTAGLPARVSFAATGTLAAQLAAMSAATPIALAIFYQGVAAGFYASVVGITFARLILAGSIVAIPVLILTSAAWLSTPGYKKTIPVTLALIAIRLRLEGEARLGKKEK